jgi:DNA-binding transcriptional ArsR family regulator
MVPGLGSRAAHLKQLTAGGLVRAERRGRQQLYSLAAVQVAEAAGSSR